MNRQMNKLKNRPIKKQTGSCDMIGIDIQKDRKLAAGV